MFRPAWWLPGAHLQTLWPTFFRRRPKLPLIPERVELSDGDFLDLLWLKGQQPRPLVLLLHGLEGSIRSPYAGGLMQVLHDHDYDVCFMYFRGCSGEPNRLDRSYHSGDTADLQEVVDHIARQHGRSVNGMIGFSLGGNVLLKWLGEQGEGAQLRCAVAVSVPYQLHDAATRMNRGFSRLYQWHLLARLRQKYQQKFQHRPSPLNVDVRQLKTFFDFDDKVTAPLHQFNGVDDYYRRSSSRQYLPSIRVPTLLIHASDDPFMFPQTVPTAAELPKQVRLELSTNGGHVGFVSGRWPWRPRYWVDERILAWCNEQIY